MGKGRFFVFNADNTVELKEWESEDGNPPVKMIQELVGGYFEAVTVLYKDQVCDGYYNEEGRLRHLPFNADASRLCGHHVVGTFIVNTPFEFDK